MMKTMKKVFMGAAALMMAVSMAGCGNSGSGNGSATTPDAGGSTGSEAAGAVKIGLHYELTGEVADYGKAELNGSLLAIKQANAAAGSEKYGYVKYDNKSDPTEAVTLAAQLASDGVAGVVGPATSGASAASYQILNDAKIPVLSPSATQNNVTLTDPDKIDSDPYDYVYRVCFEDSYQGAAMAQYAYDTLGKTKAVIYGDSTTDYAKGLSEAFEKQFTKLGGTIVAKENYVSKDTDFSSVLTKIKGLDFDVLYIPGYYNEAGLIIKQARDMGIDQAVVGSDGFDSVTLVELGGAENLNDVYFTTAYTTVGASAELQAFIDAYKAEYNEEPNMFAALAYDATNVLIQAIEEAGSSEGAAVQAALARISFNGVTGSFTFDATHTPIKPVLVVNLVDGVQTDAVAVTPKLD